MTNLKKKKSKTKSKIKGGAEILSVTNSLNYEAIIGIGLLIIILIVIIYYIHSDLQFENTRRFKRAMDLSRNDRVIAHCSDLNPNISLSLYNLVDDQVDEVKAYEIDPNAIVFAHISDLNDPMLPIVTHDPFGNVINIPFTVVFLKTTNTQGEYILTLPSGLDSVKSVEDWCKISGHCISNLYGDVPKIKQDVNELTIASDREISSIA